MLSAQIAEGEHGVAHRRLDVNTEALALKRLDLPCERCLGLVVWPRIRAAEHIYDMCQHDHINTQDLQPSCTGDKII